MKSPLFLGYVTTLWRRPWLTEQVLRQVAALREELAPEIELVPAAAGSEGDRSRSIAEKYGFRYVETANSPLGAKWNAALGLLRDTPVAGVCIFGSDDVASSRYFRQLADCIREGHDLIGMSGLYFFEQDSQRLYFWKGYPAPRDHDPAGAGRFIGRSLLDRLDWRLWPDNHERGLDSAMRGQLAQAGADNFQLMSCRDGGAVIADIKGHGGLNSFEAIAACGESMLVGDPRAFFEQNFGRKIAAALFPSGSAHEPAEDAWLWREWKNEPLEPGAQGIWCVEEDRFNAPALDFMNACRQAGHKAQWISIEAYLDRGEIGKNDLFYGTVDGSSLLAELKRPGQRKILDARGWKAQTPPDVLNYLAVPCIRPDDRGRVPLPFSAPPGYPTFGQRAHIVCCVKRTAVAVPIMEFWAASGGSVKNEGQKLFFVTAENLDPLADLGILPLSFSLIYLLRSMFRAVLFTPDTYASEAAYFLAAGTPGVCLGRWTFGKLPEGITETRTASEAIRIAAKIAQEPALWERLSQGVRKFSEAKASHFRLALKRFLKHPAWS